MLNFSILKLFSLLVYPVNQVFVLLLLGLYQLCKRRLKVSLGILSLATGWLWVCSSPFFAANLVEQLEKPYPPIAASALPEADAIILLGGAIRGRTSADTLADMSGIGDRLVFAVAAFKAGKAPYILVTGGAPEEYEAEAELIKEILLTMGVPENCILLETRNRVTLDNRQFMPETLGKLGVKSVLLVTSAFHMRRALWVFDTVEVTIHPAPTDHQLLAPEDGSSEKFSPFDYLPSVGALQRTTWVFHERVGYMYYNWFG